MDCPKLTKNYLCTITLAQTFNDDFTFIGLDKDYIPCSAMHSEKRHSINVTMAPCELAKVRLMIMAFVDTQIEDKGCFRQIYDSHFHEQVGN